MICLFLSAYVCFLSTAFILAPVAVSSIVVCRGNLGLYLAQKQIGKQVFSNPIFKNWSFMFPDLFELSASGVPPSNRSRYSCCFGVWFAKVAICVRCCSSRIEGQVAIGYPARGLRTTSPAGRICSNSLGAMLLASRHHSLAVPSFLCRWAFLILFLFRQSPFKYGS